MSFPWSGSVGEKACEAVTLANLRCIVYRIVVAAAEHMSFPRSGSVGEKACEAATITLCRAYVFSPERQRRGKCMRGSNINISCNLLCMIGG